jgi:predicted  nucleic acid-binding Zn-ribbon protein
MVVELSKLKIEEEMLKSKARILEKDFEFLGKREKALEKEIDK